MRPGCRQINDQTWGRPSAIPENQRKCRYNRGRAQKTHIASSCISMARHGKGLTSILRCLSADSPILLYHEAEHLSSPILALLLRVKIQRSEREKPIGYGYRPAGSSRGGVLG